MKKIDNFEPALPANHAFQKYREFLSTDQWILVIIVGVMAVFSISSLIARLTYELTGPYTADTPVYWAMGRGILNGLKPYTDLFEIKPPGIFYISALSFALTGDVILTHILQALMIFLISHIPFIFMFRQMKTPAPEGTNHQNFILLLLTLSFGALIGLYSAERSGEVQTESFGAAFSCLYLYYLASTDFSKRNKYFRFLIFGSLSLFFALGMKEPFLLTLVAGAMILTNSFPKFLKGFILPLFIAAILGITIMLITNDLPGYLRVYLPFTLGNHIQAYGSPFLRGLQFPILFSDLNQFSGSLGWLILILVLIFIMIQFLKLKKALSPPVSKIIFLILRVGLVVYLPVLSSGLGGQFYNHHLVFAVPMYIALFIYYIKEEAFLTPIIKNSVAAILIVLIFIGLIRIPDLGYQDRLSGLRVDNIVARAEASYIDQVLTKAGEKNYLFLGANGPHPYAYTEHSPCGPLFFQFDFYVNANIGQFKEKLIANLHSTPLVVVESYQLDKLNQEFEAYLEDNFRLEPWDSVKTIPRLTPRYKIYFRNL